MTVRPGRPPNPPGPPPGVRNDWYGLALDILRDVEEAGMGRRAAVEAAVARTGLKASTLGHMLQVGRYVRDRGPEGEVRGTLSVFQALRSLERKAPARVGDLFRVAVAGGVGRTGMEALVRAAAAAPSLAAAPREVVPGATVGAMVAWLAARAAPAGLLVGVWDRHSALSFAASAMACAAVGAKATAVCFGGKGPVDARTLSAWAAGAHPGADVDVAGKLDVPGRWADLARRRGGAGGPLVVGSRTATGLSLGDYDDLARSAALEPLAGLWDTEVDALCAEAGVPDLGDARPDPHPARLADRRGLDLALMARAGVLGRGHVEAALHPDLLASLDALSEGLAGWPPVDATAVFASPVTA